MQPESAARDREPNALHPDREIGRFDGGLPGPTVVAAAGIHGNEPSRIRAVRRVLAILRRHQPTFRGRFVGIAGNLPALARGERFLQIDLNRIWMPARVEMIRRGEVDEACPEDRQQAEILQALDRVFASTSGSVHFLDLHTSSAPGQPFVCIGDTLDNRRFAMRLGVPVILGLEEQVDGALLEYVNNRGHVTVGVEAGQHDAKSSEDYHESFLALALVAAGCVAAEGIPELDELRARLREASSSLAPVMEVRYRHAITADDRFRMQPGFSNFAPVSKEQLLATDRRGEIRAREDGAILLPLYQGLGNDGFFVVREVRPFWLRVSAWLRGLRLGRLVHWLPGVARAPGDPDTLVVDPRVARWFTVEVFHLLGFRKERGTATRLLFSRRREPA